jgi:hypothetical protein
MLLPPQRFLSGDEPYYVSRAAYIATRGVLPRAAPEHFARQEGRLFGQWNDFRPIGYPLLLTLIGVNETNHQVKRTAHSIVNYSLMCVSLILCFGLATANQASVLTRSMLAAVVGVQPWSFEYAASYLPDSANASLFFLGTVLATTGTLQQRRWARLVVGTGGGMLLSLCMWLRPEMFVFVFLPPAVLLLMNAWTGRGFRRGAEALGVSCIVLVVSFGAFVSHRVWFDGRPLARFVHATPGLEEWAKTWLSSERERYELVWRLRTLEKGFDEIPRTALGDNEERVAAVQESLLRDREGGQYSEKTDGLFLAIAESRKRDVLRNVVLPRAWSTIHLLLNLETNGQLLHWLAGVPERRIVLGLLMAVKLVLLTASALGLVCLSRRPRRNLAVILCVVALFFVVSRLLLIGAVLGSSEHRYALVCWPFLIFAACWALSRFGAVRGGEPGGEACEHAATTWCAAMRPGGLGTPIALPAAPQCC